MVAEYTPNLNLFKPGTDDNIGVETSLSENFVHIDTKLGSALKDRNNKAFTGLKERLDEEQLAFDNLKTEVATVGNKVPNIRSRDYFFRAIAHRGSSTGAPENTLTAFRHAIDQNFWGIKVEAQLTSDKKWVCIADTTIDRTSNGSGLVSSKSLSALRGFDFGSWRNARYKDERIPTLDEFLETCLIGHVVPYIEIKGTLVDSDIQSLIDTIQKWNMSYNVSILSSSLTNLQKVRILTKDVSVGYMPSTFVQKDVDDTVALGNSFLCPPYSKITSSAMTMAKTAGLQVESQEINDMVEIRALAGLGVKTYLTNRIPLNRGY